MKILRAALLAAVAAAPFLAPASARAQTLLGVHGTLADVRDVTPGVGGSIGFLRRSGISSEFGAEISGTYYLPSCRGLECDAWGAEAVLVGVRPLAGRARTYLALGAKYVKVTGSNGSEWASGDAWGGLVKFGSSYGTESLLRPYFEFGWAFMSSAPDIWEGKLGLRAAVGGSR